MGQQPAAPSHRHRAAHRARGRTRRGELGSRSGAVISSSVAQSGVECKRLDQRRNPAAPQAVHPRTKRKRGLPSDSACPRFDGPWVGFGLPVLAVPIATAATAAAAVTTATAAATATAPVAAAAATAPTAATATATAAAAACVAAEATATATTAPFEAARLTRPRFVDGQCSAVERSAVHRLDGTTRFLLGCHLHEAEAS